MNIFGMCEPAFNVLKRRDPSFLISLLALNKIGAIAVLINTSLTGDPLVHCINSSDAVKCIVGAERAEPLEGVLNQINITKQEDFLWAEDTDQYSLPDWAIDLKAQLDFSDDKNLEETNAVKIKDVACYIFTSGTTGVPKAAICPNQKLMAASVNIKIAGYRVVKENYAFDKDKKVLFISAKVAKALNLKPGSLAQVN